MGQRALYDAWKWLHATPWVAVMGILLLFDITLFFVGYSLWGLLGR